MAKQPKPVVTLAAIEASLAEEGEAFLARFRKRRPAEQVYAFLFELSAVGYAAAAAIATEEALARHAEESAESYDDDVDRARADLRWAGPEEGWHPSADKDFRGTQKLLDVAEDVELYPEYDGTLERTALAALRRMIDRGVFGDAEARERLVLGVCHTGGDNSEEDFLRWAAEVNSPTVLERLRAELARRG